MAQQSEVVPNTDENVRATEELLKQSGRSCGDCYACCFALGIESLKKWPGQTCKHLDGSIADKRCTIYSTRPRACSHYYCAWLVGMGDSGLRPDRSGILVTLYPPIEYDRKLLGYDPGTMKTRYGATVHVTDLDKAGKVTDEGSNINKVIHQLITDGCNDIRVLTNGNVVGSGLLHFHNGVVRQGRVMPPKERYGYEELNFVTHNPPIGNYQMVERSEYEQVKEKLKAEGHILVGGLVGGK